MPVFEGEVGHNLVRSLFEIAGEDSLVIDKVPNVAQVLHFEITSNSPNHAIFHGTCYTRTTKQPFYFPMNFVILDHPESLIAKGSS